MSTPGWTWHAKRWHPKAPQADGVYYSSGGIDNIGEPFTEAEAKKIAASWLFNTQIEWSVEAYVMSPDRVAYGVAERGPIWWPRLGADL